MLINCLCSVSFAAMAGMAIAGDKSMIGPFRVAIAAYSLLMMIS